MNSVLLIHCISGGMMAISNTCHRVILTFVCYRCFKREFPEAEALRMWEACWANYLTDYFHLFLCLAIISIYSDDVIAQDLRTDEMLLHFSSLAMFMDGELILRKVNILCGVFNFNNMYVIPPNIPRQMDWCSTSHSMLLTRILTCILHFLHYPKNTFIFQLKPI